MNVQVRETPRGQFTTTTGICRVVQAKRRYPKAPLVDVELAVEDEKRLKATFDLDSAPFAAGFAEGIAAFVVRNRMTDFGFRVDTIRKVGVDAQIPFAKLNDTEIFHSLVVLTPVMHEQELEL